MITRSVAYPVAFLSVFLSVAAAGSLSFTVGSVAWQLGTDSTMQIGVVSSDTSAWSGHIIVEGYGGTLTNPAATSNAGFHSTIAAYLDDLGNGFAMNVPRRTSPGYPNGNNQMAGTQFTMDLTMQHLAIVSLWDDSRDARLGPVQYERVRSPYLIPGVLGADCGGPYWIAPGESIALLGYRSMGESYQWSIDGHIVNTTGDEFNKLVSYDYLVNTLGLTTGVHNVELKVGGDSWDVGYTHIYDYTTLTIVPEPATALLLGLGCLMTIARRKSR